MKMKTLETERLILRNWKESDLDDFYEYARVDGVGEMAGWPHHQNIAESQRILTDFMANDEEYALVLKAQNKVIGSLGIHHKTKDPQYQAEEQREIGYVLSKKYWGQGLIPEAVRAALKYAFEELDVDVLWCAHFSTNLRSKRVIEKSGFRFYRDGIYEAAALKRSFEDKIYILTKAEYEAMRG